MRRRDFIMGIASSVAWPTAAQAQQPATPIVGYLANSSPGTFTQFVTAFHRGLSEVGYVEGQNVAIEYRWSEGCSMSAFGTKRTFDRWVRSVDIDNS